MPSSVETFHKWENSNSWPKPKNLLELGIDGADNASTV